ncbi:hypothetical protein ACHAAC_05860 [Aeromicrobium sp. CF4.19]|uniref:hypothetical protein n=1 Tax=Aeromicrobium sp. CF4.19 TaxID=3373082 RepID=UPI003EE6DCDC
MSDEVTAERAVGDHGAGDGAEEAAARRAELMDQAREAVQGRPELEELLERVSALDTMDLPHHVAELDAVHRVLRDVLAAAGRNDAPAS